AALRLLDIIDSVRGLPPPPDPIPPRCGFGSSDANTRPEKRWITLRGKTRRGFALPIHFLPYQLRNPHCSLTSHCSMSCASRFHPTNPEKTWFSDCSGV